MSGLNYYIDQSEKLQCINSSFEAKELNIIYIDMKTYIYVIDSA